VQHAASLAGVRKDLHDLTLSHQGLQSKLENEASKLKALEEERNDLADKLRAQERESIRLHTVIDDQETKLDAVLRMGKELLAYRGMKHSRSAVTH